SIGTILAGGAVVAATAYGAHQSSHGHGSYRHGGYGHFAVTMVCSSLGISASDGTQLNTLGFTMDINE
ncbi:hypothetical protein Tco_1435475, partial [Tanacetum coccineum]